ncbi:unnamed protein product [Thelazia callipaeda]|uniref:Soluble calcium-activated nucleotidase 1 n=1 Tax=Thelazia callipaeda TaxID=103827 RepID=A0A0N5D509_THECL|nr:unnamed protein product [Thelazia callipaeda]
MGSPETRMKVQKRDIRFWTTGSFLTLTLLLSVLCASFSLLMINMQKPGCSRRPYNASQLGHEIFLDDGSREFRITVVTDLDKNSKHPTKNQWHSFMEYGTLTVNSDYTKASVQWDNAEKAKICRCIYKHFILSDFFKIYILCRNALIIKNTLIVQVSLHSTLATDGRSMELSDLVVFDGNLLSIDDRTGIIYQIKNKAAYPWVFISDGAGNATKGLKGEWMTVKNSYLCVGGLGKEWTDTKGVFLNENPMWVKFITSDGRIEHVRWVDEYKKLRAAVGIEWPGYMIHESVQWSSIYNKWFFLPRRVSKYSYNDVDDEKRGANYLLIASEDFSNINYRQIGRSTAARGFSAFQFIPGSKDRVIVALKSEEEAGIPVASYITVFNHETNHILLDEIALPGKFKYEGIAFV